MFGVTLCLEIKKKKREGFVKKKEKKKRKSQVKVQTL